jgi:hypothetical protein
MLTPAAAQRVRPVNSQPIPKSVEGADPVANERIRASKAAGDRKALVRFSG